MSSSAQVTRYRFDVREIVDRLGRRATIAIVIALVLAVSGAATAAYVMTRPPSYGKTFPQNAAMENQLGIRFARIAVVADGGLVSVSYVVLDSEKARRFQADISHAPVLSSDARDLRIKRVALMRQGHNLRAGQTYYLVYQNFHRALRSGERATIVIGDLRLKHAPVL